MRNVRRREEDQHKVLETLRGTLTVRPRLFERSREQIFFVHARPTGAYLLRLRDLSATAAVPLHEPLDEIDRAESRQRRRLRPDDPKRGTGKMRRGGKLQDVR